MDTFVTELSTGLNATAFWGAISEVAGIVVVLVLVAFGIRTLRRVVSGASKGKAKF